MKDEPDNTPLDGGVTDNVKLSDDDTSEEFVYFDPDEDQDTEEGEQSDETDDETDEVEEDDQEADDPADEDEPIEDFVTKLKSETPRLAEYLEGLEKGNLRQEDYSRKTQEIANERNTLKADVERMQRITEVFVDHITSLVPDAPDASLALSKPEQYVAQKAQHEAAMAQVQKLIEMGEAPKEIGGKLSGDELKKQLQQANSKLIEMFPEAAGGESRERFFGGVQSVANDLGFTNEELSSTTDPRMFALAHWAKKGMEADKAKATAKAKVAKAPPATPRKPGQGAGKVNGNAEAMQKLSRSGTLKDALAVDWE